MQIFFDMQIFFVFLSACKIFIEHSTNEHKMLILIIIEENYLTSCIQDFSEIKVKWQWFFLKKLILKISWIDQCHIVYITLKIDFSGRRKKGY